jgi:hypothetical protein
MWGGGGVRKQLGLLQQPDVYALTIATVDDYERLVGAVAHKKSPTEILKARCSQKQLHERLEVVLYTSDVPPRLPDDKAKFEALKARMLRLLNDRVV